MGVGQLDKVGSPPVDPRPLPPTCGEPGHEYKRAAHGGQLEELRRSIMRISIGCRDWNEVKARLIEYTRSIVSGSRRNTLGGLAWRPYGNKCGRRRVSQPGQGNHCDDTGLDTLSYRLAASGCRATTSRAGSQQRRGGRGCGTGGRFACAALLREFSWRRRASPGCWGSCATPRFTWMRRQPRRRGEMPGVR